MKILFYISAFIVLNAHNCSKTTEFINIKFGEGGGFTGALIEYEIQTNGDVFRNTSLNKEHTKIKTLTKSDIKEIQNRKNKISVDTYSFNRPGNLYYFIETDNKKITWGDPTFKEPKEIKELYEQLNKIVSTK
jgi:hypothetical protein